MRHRANSASTFGVGFKAKSGLGASKKVRGQWSMRCLREGVELWREDWENLVTNAGLDYLIDVALGGASQSSTWYLGLVNGASPTFAAGDTMASHGGWTEDQNYDEANRVTWSDGGVSGGSLNNSGSPAQFTMSDSTTIGGAFLTNVSTKGGTTGILYAEGDFATDRVVIDNDVLEVTATFSVADDGA